MSRFGAWLRGVDEGANSAEFSSNSLERLIVADKIQRLVLDSRKALGVAAIFRARQMTADALSSVPVRIGDGLAPAPNDEQSMQEFVNEIALSLMDNGDAYLYDDGKGLFVIPANEMVAVWGAGSPGIGLRRRRYLWGERVMRTSGAFPNLYVISYNRAPGDVRGTGPMQSDRITGVLAAQKYVEEFYTYNAQPSGILKVAGKLTEEEAGKLKKQWMDNRTSREIGVLSENYEFMPMSFNPTDAAWVETHRISTGDVALLFGLDGSILNYNTPGSSLTYQSMGDVAEQWWRSTLFPYYAKRIEEKLTQYFREQVRFDPEQLFLASLTDRTNAAGILVRSGYDPADAADVSGLPPMKHTGVLPVTVQPQEGNDGAI